MCGRRRNDTVAQRYEAARRERVGNGDYTVQIFLTFVLGSLNRELQVLSKSQCAAREIPERGIALTSRLTPQP